MHTTLLALAYVTLFPIAASAHSWVEQLRIIRNGTYSGRPGYMRGYVPRGPGFSDALNQNLLPPLESGRIRIDGSDSMCKSTQTTSQQTDGFPKLSASPGDYVALRYLENGHVTLPENQVGKPGSGGTVMVYATTEPKEDEKLTTVLKWNAKGTGGDKRGRLLTVQNFDDGRCYQINSSPRSLQRQEEFPNKPLGAPAGTPNEEMWCETDIKLPVDTSAAKTLTLYWAWQWDTQANMDPGLPKGKDEWYTSCMDIDVNSPGRVSAASLPVPKQLLVQDPQQHANPAFTDRAANISLPDGGPDGGDGDLGNSVEPVSSPVNPPFPTTTPATTPVTTSPGEIAPSSSTETATLLEFGNHPLFGTGTTLMPIPDVTAESPASAAPTDTPFSTQTTLAVGQGSPHTLTLTQVMTITTNFKRSAETVTTEVIDFGAVRRRNVWA